jgi:hypothetical protein
VVKTRSCLYIQPFLYIKCIFLPRQARDKHRESTQKRQLFCCRHRANGTIFANGTKVHTYYDAELGTNSTGYDGTLGADWDSISGCVKRHLFLSFPYVCPEPVLAK